MSEAKGPKPMPFSEYLNTNRYAHQVFLNIPQIQPANTFKTPPDMLFSSITVAVFKVDDLIALVRGYEDYVDNFMSNPDNV